MVFENTNVSTPVILAKKDKVNEAGQENLTFILPENENSFKRNIFKLKAKKFRKGLRNSFKIGRWIAKKAAKKDRKWFIPAIRVDFSMTYTGIFGLSQSSAAIVTETFLVKDQS